MNLMATYDFLFAAGGKQLDANQEMIALGICNFMGSFVSSMPGMRPNNAMVFLFSWSKQKNCLSSIMNEAN